MRGETGGRGSGLDDGDDQADRGEDAADTDTLGLRSDLDHRLARVVDLPRDLPALGLAAGDGLLKLSDDLLEGVTVTVVQDRHPRRGHRALDRLLDIGVRSDLLGS